MCLIAIAYRVLPDWPLLVLANRDEFYARPAAPLAPWADSGLLAGRDLEAGGTWLGLHPQGRFAAVTNVTETPPDPMPPASRGALVERFLAGRAPSLTYLEALAAEHDAYRGFNLLTFDGETLAYGSNRGKATPEALAPGIYALANAGLRSGWPKQQRIAEGFAAQLQAAAGLSRAQLRTLLSDQTPVDTEALRAAGLPPERFAATASCFIRGEAYGTRASTLAAVGADRVWIEESRFGPGGRWEGTQALGRHRQCAGTHAANQSAA
jgi:uncharacterized protein with NRDE domain